MSHSKMNKRGCSVYIENWNPSAKKFINTCSLCGATGYNPSIENEGFIHPSPDVTDFEHRAIYAELTQTLEPLSINSVGICSVCAKILGKESDK